MRNGVRVASAVLARGRARAIAMIAIASIGASATSAGADEFLDKANAPYVNVAEAQRSDVILLPLLAALEAPPAAYKTQADAAMFASDGPGWAEASEWTQKPAQKALLEQLPKLTSETNRAKAFAFAQPYGVAGVSTELIAKEMYTELGEPPLLSAARHLYMPSFERAGILVHVEASRLNSTGNANGAVTLLTDWLFICRQMADRQMYREKRWAMDSMKLALQRISDVVHADLRSSKRSMEYGKIKGMVNRLRDERGFLALDRIRLPEGEFFAKDQLVKSVMNASGAPDSASFGPTLARSSASERPLRLFSASAFWDNVRPIHGNLRETRDLLRAVQGDWTRRWDVPFTDRILVGATDYRRRVATTSKFAALQSGLSDIESLFPLRQELRSELAGARMALGAYGFFLQNRSMPGKLSAMRPAFIEGIDRDPFSGRRGDVEFFVPMRDTPKDAEGNPKPHEIDIFPEAPMARFRVRLGEDVFVIYSVGPDDDRGNALYATQMMQGVPGDYLLFPPVIALKRQRLLETGQLK
jgi:hypothetical protein